MKESFSSMTTATPLPVADIRSTRNKPEVVPLAPVIDVPEMLRKLADELDRDGVYLRAVVVLDAPDALDVRAYGPGLEPLQAIGVLTLGVRQLTDLLYEGD